MFQALFEFLLLQRDTPGAVLKQSLRVGARPHYKVYFFVGGNEKT